MSSGEAAEGWYVRSRGRIHGPMSWDQLVAMRLRGQVARFDQLSRDGRTWDPADSVDELFPRSGTPGAFVPPPGERKKSTSTGADTGTGTGAGAGSGRNKGAAPEEVGFLILDDEPGSPGRGSSAPATTGRRPAAIPRPGAADDPPAWFYADAGMPRGPVPLSELKDLAGAGRIHPDSLYWRAGLDQWTAGNALPELAALWRPEVKDGTGTGTGAVTLPPRSRTGAPGPDGPIPPLDPLATASLPLNLLCGLGNLAAIVAAVVALRRIGRSNGSLRGRGFALAGLAIGLVGTLASVFILIRIFGGQGADG